MSDEPVEPLPDPKRFDGSFNFDGVLNEITIPDDQGWDFGDKDFQVVWYSHLDGAGCHSHPWRYNPWHSQYGPNTGVPLCICMATKANPDEPEKGPIYGVKLNKYPDVDRMELMVNGLVQTQGPDYWVEDLVCWIKDWKPGDTYTMQYTGETFQQRIRRKWR